MADVYSLDVHGVRYAEIFTSLRQDLKLEGMGFKALIDFTSVETMRASLERVIADKLGQEAPQVETMCYYKKRRRGAVVIHSQRDVILACCEYPPVNSEGKPAPDPYIKVGVLLSGTKSPFIGKQSALNALDVRKSSVVAVTQSHQWGLGRTGIRPPMMRSLLKNPTIQIVTKPATATKPIPHIRADNATTTPTFILDDQPLPKRVCLGNEIEWSLALPGKSGGTVEIRPIQTSTSQERPPEPLLDQNNDDQVRGSSPELAVQIKDEPQDPDDTNEDKKFLKSSGDGCVNRKQAKVVHTYSTRTKYNGSKNDSSSAENYGENSDDEPMGTPLVISPKEEGAQPEGEMKQIWDQLRNMESRLNNVGKKKTSSNTGIQNNDDETSGSSEDLSAKIANLEHRLYSMEKGKEESDAPLLYLGDRLSKVEKNVGKIINAVDKLSKSLLMVHRKQRIGNTSIDVISTSLKELGESQRKTQESLEKMNTFLEKKLG